MESSYIDVKKENMIFSETLSIFSSKFSRVTVSLLSSPE